MNIQIGEPHTWLTFNRLAPGDSVIAPNGDVWRCVGIDQWQGPNQLIYMTPCWIMQPGSEMPATEEGIEYRPNQLRSIQVIW